MGSIMNSATYVALSAQSALQRQMAVTANNVANASTPGYKAQNIMFAEYLSGNQASEQAPTSFVRDLATVRNETQGSLSWTQNSLDLALQGSGYFKVDTPNGPRYTRNGQFQIDTQGQVVTAESYPVLDQGDRPIVVPPGAGSIEIAADGSVTTQRGPLGRFGVVNFANPADLTPSSAGLFVTEANPTPATKTTVVQGAIETSNVNPIVEMTRLMDVSRNYTTAQNLIDSEDQRMRTAIDQLGKVA